MTTALNSKESISESLYSWIASRTDEAVFNPKNGYYPFSVIADAFEKGVEHGSETVRQEMKEGLRRILVDKTKQSISIINQYIETFKSDGIEPKKLFVDLSIGHTKILIAIEEESYISEKFISKYYSMVSDTIAKYHEKETTIEVGFLNNATELNVEMLKADGFHIGINLNTLESIF